jgi:hypothetical protein
LEEKKFFPKKAYGDAIEHGKKYETEAFAAYAMSCSDIVMSAGFVICKKFPWLGYSPDGIVVNSSGIPQKLLEIKCPVKGKLNKMQSKGSVQNMLKQF